MDEFIVWDIEGKCWIPKSKCAIATSNSTSNIAKGFTLLTEVESNEYSECFVPDFIPVQVCNYIGKTDIEGNKIYADSSIVEFNMSGSKKNFKATGFFTFNKKNLSYEFVCFKIDKKKLNSCRYDIDWRNAYKDTFKIIGTLQEDKHLIGESDGR